jgi:flavin reductase (DIM6/NTAB) family NADH-FMN oxidoreductase RutF
MEDVLQVDPDKIPAHELQTYLQAAVAPRPIAFASTVDLKGNINLSPFSFFNVFSANPPVLVFSPSRRVRDNTTKHTLENILEVPEVSISVVTYDMAERMSFASSEFPKEINEFEAAGFAASASVKIRPPYVAESPVSFECVVEQVVPLGSGGGAGNLVIARVVYMHILKKHLDDQHKLSNTSLDLVARMGGDYYCRVVPDSLFQIKKPG